MGTYKALKGQRVNSLSSDPSADADSSGRMWYNTTSNALKYTGAGTGAWSTGGSMSTTRNTGMGAGTSSSSFLATGGISSWPSSGNTSAETYNGTSWTGINSINGGRFKAAGFGTISAAIIATGYKPYPTKATSCEDYNGTSWTEINDVNNPKTNIQGTGDTSSAIMPCDAVCESWNGTSWSNVNVLNEDRESITMCGTGTSALAINGSGATTDVEEWNGTGWTEIANNTNGRTTGAAGGGPAKAILCSGTPTSGYPFNYVESFNGTAWSAAPATTQIRQTPLGGGTAASLITAGGYTAPPADTYLSSSEEWSKPVYATRTVTVS